ncbi:MAG TPA: beta-propeller domain-containing protein [Allosphingosinicella sp.]|jgi:hypothetical protein
MRNAGKLFSALALLLCIGTAASIVAPSREAAAQSTSRPSGSLTAFKSDAELRTFLQNLRKRQQRVQNLAVADSVMSMPAPPSPPPPPAAQSAPSAEAVVVTGARVANPSITNNQEVGVDEGGIVKVRGDTLVILRRGRLFTVSLAGGGMRPIDSINAFPPGVSGQGDWYDEMLLSGDRVIVVGYSYARGGTEINRFRLDAAGRLRFEDAWHLKSNDYYSSRNYASRLIGNRLVFYTPLYLGWNRDPLEALPGVRRWRPGSTDRSFRRIAPATQIFIPPALRNRTDAQIEALHSVTSCDLTAADLGCTATGVLGPSSRTFYVSGGAVYLWMSDAWSWDARRRGANAFVYRMPLNLRERPSAVATRGAPVDQFSFREDSSEGILNVLLRAGGGGDAMFDPESSGGSVALLRLRMSDFSDGSREAPRARYRFLPGPRGESWNFRNRFVGDHVLYGGGAFGREGGATLFAAPLRGGETEELRLPHAVDRLEVLGRDAMVIGGAERGLGFTAVELAPGRRPRLGDRYLHPDSAEGESRSHAFFFSPDPNSPDGASGTVGLPVARRADPAHARFFGSSAAMLFLRRMERRLSPAGELEARPRDVGDDACQASCVDWYGNARPIFLGGRTFALLGYELVEGRFAGNRIREVDRVSFAPRIGRPR